ncbi:MAG: beta-propeller domain-containing protein [Gammaproteobacteria bacterium]|nr:beta-propeller domain-containing protein [Gammaproteobacteria bacterium]
MPPPFRTVKIITIIAGIVLISGCPQLTEQLEKNNDSPETDEPANNALLKNFTTPDALEERIKKGITQQYSGSYLKGGGIQDGVVENFDLAAAPAASGSKTESRVSATNLQESGVDEADRIKTDGQYLYIAQRPTPFLYKPLLSDDVAFETSILKPSIEQNSEPEFAHIRILKFSDNPQSAEEVSKIKLKKGEYINGTYLLNERDDSLPDTLVTVGQYQEPIARDWFASPWVWQSGTTRINLIQVDNPVEPTIETTLQFDGHLVSSRRIGEILYLVTRFNPYIKDYITYPSTPEEETRNQTLLDETALADLLPQWSIGDAEKTDLLSAESCYLAPTHNERGSADIISVVAIDLTRPESKPNTSCMIGPTETIYVSLDSMYLATTRYDYSIQPGAGIQPVPEIRSVVYPQEITTEIHKFSFTDQGPEYRGSGVADGHLGWEQDKKSFRMGENDGVLRIATSLGDDWNATATTRLTLFRETEKTDALALEEIARLPNKERPAAIGKPGERLYASRFIGDRAYLVTFRMTDPLYVLNLSDPTDPFIAGDLEIPGYSDYLHPVNDNLMIGLGKDAVADTTSEFGDGRGAWVQGLKLALFDIADPANPKELQSLSIGQRGTQSEALIDHLAFTWLAADDGSAQLALPIKLHGQSNGELFDPKQPSSWAPWTHTGLYLFNVNDGSQGKPASIEEQGKMIIETADNTKYGYGDTSGDRAVIRNDGVHYINGNGVWSANWDNVKGTLTERQ